MQTKVLLVTPPFTQLNTPYPATAYLKGFLDSKAIACQQMDLSIHLFCAVFTKTFIQKVFAEAEKNQSFIYEKVWQQREEYSNKVDDVMLYLTNHQTTEAYKIIHPHFLPIAHRAENIEEEMDWAFGNLGVLDKAKHLATLFIEELGDFIQANVDDFFSFTKYAEQIAHAASDFKPIDDYLHYEPTIVEQKMLHLLEQKINATNPTLVCFTIPFPGNLFAALRCGQYLKLYFPHIKIAIGGGYCNTELRAITETKVFQYLDFICLDDGEIPILKIIEQLETNGDFSQLERTFVLEKNKVVFKNKLPNTILVHSQLPAPSYIGLTENTYLSFLDVMNPMHRLWSDGRWNKLTVAHGCYWKKCSFCDTSLDYINIYQNTTANDLVNKIEHLITETGITGFHFVDEAAPPKALKALAEKLIERKVYITWWTNIRFEKTFDDALCSLLAKSGCIAVTGGLEVASDRLLKKMQKGVDVAQVAKVTKAFSQNGIMVHAYLMYGFPTQTDQETIDALEVVRQLFDNECIHSAFWHKFTATIHSPIGKNPSFYDITITGPKFAGFAQNDLIHIDPKGAKHEKYTKGLNLALSNYMNGLAIDTPLQEWFNFKIKPTSLPYDLITKYLKNK
jgi:tRNA A37 methylthiotransferase MiaB